MEFYEKNTENSPMETYSIQPVGYIQSPFTEKGPGPAKSPKDPVKREKELKALQEKIKNTTSIIHILPEYEALLDGISEFSHILVVFWPHLLQEADRQKKKVHPRGWKDLPQQGIFATRSPARPNPLLITTGKLVKRQGCLLHVKGLEAFDNTPVIDIKPVIESPGPLEDFRVPDWVRMIHD